MNEEEQRFESFVERLQNGELTIADKNYILNTDHDLLNAKLKERGGRLISKQLKTDKLNEIALITPADVLSFKYPNTKIANNLETFNFNSVAKHGVSAEIASAEDKKKGLSRIVTVTVINYNEEFIRANGSTFEYTNKASEYVATAGTIFNDETIRKNGGKVKLKHFLNIKDGRNAATVSQKELETALNDLNLMSQIQITLDASQHAEYNAANKHKKQLATPFYQRKYLLPNEIETDPETGEIYVKILGYSPIFENALDTNQISTYPSHIRDLTRCLIFDDKTGEVKEEKKTIITRRSDQTDLIRNYFLYNAIYYLNENPQLTYIERKYETIYEWLIEREPKIKSYMVKKKYRVDENILKVLEVLKNKGVIDNFIIKPKGKIKLYKIQIFKAKKPIY